MGDIGNIRKLKTLPFTKELTPADRRSLNRTGRGIEGKLTPDEEMGEAIANAAAQSGTVVSRTTVERGE